MGNMHSPGSSVDITKQSFWAQRLQTAENSPTTAVLFDKVSAGAAPIASNDAMAPQAYARTSPSTGINPSELKVAAIMHYLSPDTLVLAAWAVLCRSYAGEDGSVSFGACLDREKAAWLFAMPVSGEDKLLSAMRAAEQEKKLVLDHALTFESMAAFAESTGYSDLATAVHIYSGKPKSPGMHLPSLASLIVNVGEGSAVQVYLSYRQDTMTVDRAQSIVDNFNHVLTSLTKRLQSVNKVQLDELLIRDIDAVSRNDYRRIVDFSAPLPNKLDTTVHELILSRCSAPGADRWTAVDAWDGSFTYAELAGHISRLAGAISDAAGPRNHRRGQPKADGSQLFVPFCLTKSKWTPVAILAIMAAGGACVPLEPSHPPARRNEILTQTKAKIVLTNKTLYSQGLAESFMDKTLVRHVLCIDAEENTSDRSTFPKARPTVLPDDLCYIIFTSGSSGTPKGVKWAHTALATSAWEHGRAFHMDVKSRVLQFASHVFDVSVAELVTPLIHGGCVVVPADEDRTDPASMAKFMDKMKVTNAILVPSFARLLKPYAVPSLKSLVLGGESIGQDNLDNWTPQLDRFVIGYGSAETAVCCARNEFSVKTRARKPWVEGLGTGCGGRMLIADRDNADRLVPIGAVGEIIVEGPILADGYLNDASKTARAFVENPAWATKAHFRTGNGSSRRRFYRTGDLGRQAMDGSITFMGRADFQVKVRGQRMELGEVRSHMIDCLPEAVDIHVDVIRPVAADGAGGDKSLAAFISFGHSSDDIVVSQPDSSLAEALRTMLTRLREVLPPAAIPTFFIPLGGFPYLVSGKVDRRRLLAFANQSTVEDLSAYNATFIGSSGSGEIVATAAPETELEKVLVECCGKILRLPSLSANSNFFASGGDSISAIKVVAEAREKGVNIAVGDIFSTSSIRELAGHVTASSGQYTFSRDSEYIDNAVDAFSLLEPDQIREAMTDLQKQGVTYYGITDLYPCTPLQEALIALSGTRTGAYVSQHILDLPRHVDIAAFKASWAAIVQKHDILRTRIFEGPQGAVQAVCDSEIEWATGPNLSVYCAQDKSLPMGFGDNLVRFGLVGRTFVLTIHHSIFDGWSIARLFEDVERHYAGQKSLDLKQFKYFIQYSSRLDTEEPKRFWESVLASESGLASCHFPQNLGASHTPIPDSAVKLTIPTSQYAKSDFTIPTRIRAAWALLVGRYIDSQDVIFGETLSGRMSTMPDVQAISGPTISTVPFRVKWTSNEPVSNLLHEIQSQVIDMTNSGHIGVQNISRLNATAQEACQFQHIIVIQPKKSSLRPTGNDAHGTRQRIGLEDATLDLRNFHNYALNMDFTLEEDAVMVTTTFDSRVFSARDIEHLQSQFHHVLDQVCRSHNDPQSSIGDIDYAGRKDTQVQIDTNNSRALSDDFEPTSLLRFLGRHVAEHPEAPAVAAWDGSMTYKELDRVSTALANHLSSSGLRHGDCIPYCFPKSIWATVSILATIKIGAISVALEPAYPDAGLAKVISQVKPRMILCSDDLSSRLRSLGQGTSSLFAVDSRSTRECIRASDKAAKRKYNVRHDDTAFIVFTSGSTGEPKGIPLDHGAVCIMARQHGKVMNIDRHSRILQFAAHVFDVSLGDMATALLHGACLCVPSDDDRMSNLARSINYLDANRAWLTPTVASLISPAECPTLEWLSVGGEQLTQTCKDIWASVPLVNVYGPAEVTNIGTAVKVSPDLSLTNIGRANGVKVWICEPGNTQKLAPVGCVGEIVFEGRNVSRGYLNNIDLTASAFPELLSWTSGRMQGGKNPVRMYRTGDLGRLNADGSIEFMGRKDTQIKLRGQRVEVTAVETALKAATDEPVDLAVDILHGSGDSDASLVAFLHLPSRQAGFADNTSDIFSTTIDIRSLATDVRSRVKADLPAHMIPTLFIPLSRLPKLVSGKIDRKMLRLAAKKLTDNEIRSFKLDQGASKQQPRTPAEAVMQKLWASILRLPESDIGVDDDFVSLGGDSITAIKLVAQARAQDIQLSVAKVFQQATIANICGTTNIPVAAVPVEPEGTSIAPAPVTNDPKVSGKWADIALQCDVSESQIEDVYPCTALQEGMLMLTEKKPTAYIAHHVMPLPSWVDISIFRRAWEAVIRTHAILRTRITVEGQQVVLRAGSVGWTTPVSNDLSAYIEQTGLTPMGFGRCLSRQAILDHPKRFVWAAHHSLYDGWSMPLLAEAITKAYMRLSGRDISLDQPKDACLSFKDFVDHISSVSKDETETFWQDQLNGADPAAFPPGMPSSYEPLADSMVEKTVAFNRDQRSKTTTSAMIRAAWAILVSAYSGSHPDIVFGSAVTGRSVPLDGVLELIGPTLATVPVRVVLDPKQSLRSLLAKVQQQSLAMLEYEQHGLQNIRKAVPSAPTACDFQSLLVVHAEGGAQTTSSQTNLSWSNDRGAESKFLTTAVTLECQPVGSKLALAASFDSSIMDQKQMQRMLATFEHILRQVCSGENTLIVGDIETISPDDRAEISSIAKDLPPVTHERVHDMFARQAAMTPDAMAVSASDGDFTYRQLDHLSTKVSRHLRSLGVGAECFVPFCFEKSKWVPVALLAILKAGGACVPLDPAQPLDRLQHITGTLDARVIVTSATHDRLLEDVPGVQHIVPVSEDSLNTLAIAAPSARRAGVKAEPSPSSACYAIFTSGSTGTPKGVVWEHATLCSSMTEHGAAFNYSMKSRVLQFSSHTFDVSVSELLTTLVHGGCLCIPDDFTRLNDIAGFIAEKQVNWAFFAPSFARLMNPATVPGLETVVLGGEAPGKDNIERWSGRPGLELIVTYGPAESCIYCAKNSVRNSSGMIDGSIGHAIGGTMWVADLGRPDRLAPIGSVGEIAVEGSILARGYLKDAAKTASSFRPMPADWANGRSSRVYYTGDLGRVNSDGTISCLGRRDDQVKIRGQRVELADIEYHLRKDDEVRQALVLYPRTGPCADHLTGILSMKAQDGSSKPSPSSDITMASAEEWEPIAAVQERLESKVPSYMVPANWIVLDSIPLMPASQKVNRKMVSEWTKQMDRSTYEEITRLSSDQTTGTVSALADKLEEKIRDLWCAVLNINRDIIGPNTSFLRIGGDSITAMQIISRCRNEGIYVAVQDLLKAKNFTEFCGRVRAVKAPDGAMDVPETVDDEDGTPFSLSPIQSWFMTLAPYGENHFNQSHLLRFTEEVKFDALQAALLAIVQRHPMLRARFEFAPDGAWQQCVFTDAEEFLQCRSFQSVTMKKAAAYAFNAQASLDIVNGPLLAADMYAMTNGTLALFITCHHLVIDLVSWRIILQELEEILRIGKTATDRKSLSFRTWSRLLEEHSGSSSATNGNLFDNAPSADWNFWGISSGDNVVANITEQNFDLDQDATQLLLGNANDAFNTEPLDLLLTAVLHSFNQVFRGFHGPIAVFNESHGREPWRPEIDVSSTVGWFTSMCPVTLSDHGGDVLRSLQEVKDLRRRSSDTGLSAFGRFAKQADDAVEVTFNYFGLFQQFEKEGSLLNQMSWDPVDQPSDASPDVPRFSLFDISAGVENGTLKVNFAFSDRINHQSLVRQWVDACSSTLGQLVHTTSEHQYDASKTLTLSDFPHLPATYDELSVMLTTTLPNAGVSVDKVQDIYPCSSMQTALLMSQGVDKSLYAVRYVWEVIPKTTGPASLERMKEAWKKVIQSHPMLRTVFVQGLSSGDGKRAAVYHQVVLKELEPSMVVCKDPFSFPVGQPQDHIQGGAAHHVVLCQEYSGKLLVQLDISHALVDGTSINILIDSMIKAYDGTAFTGGDQDCYANFVSYLRDQDVDESLTFWKTYLAGQEPCHFPSLRSQMKTAVGVPEPPAAHSSLEYLDFHFPNPTRLHSSCMAAGTTTASVFKLAWALVLQSYTGVNAPCFGFLASGRDLPIDGIEAFVGPFINMLVCQVSLEEEDATVEAVLSRAHSDYANCLAYQVCSLAEILRALQLPGGGRLFNTVMSVQRLLPPGTATSKVDFKPVHVEDPSEFDVVLNIGDSADLVDVSLTYNTSILSKDQAEHLGAVFNRAIDSVLDCLDKKINNIDLLIPQDYQQMIQWNNNVDTNMVEALCDDLVGTQLASRAAKPAIAGWDLSLTYAELDNLSTTLADHLVSRYAVGRNVLVPFCFEKSSWAIVVMLGIIKSGAAFVPLDPKHPVDRLAEIVQRVGAPLIITSEKKADLAPGLGAHLPHLIVGANTMTAMKGQNTGGRFLGSRVKSDAFRRDRHPTDLAYCLFTSGSTGTPKGVLIQHQTMCTSTTAHGKAFGYNAPDLRTIQFSSYAFDACIAEIFTTLIFGGCVCVPSDEHKMDPRQLMAFLEKEQTSMVFLTPAVLALLDEKKLPFVKCLLVGGEAVPRQLVEGWMSPQRRVLVVYGPTECCVYCSGYDCTAQGGLPIGRNMIGTTVGSVSWVSTSHDPNRLAPIGAIGELLIEGPILAKGYLDDEVKTAASFVKPTWMGGDRVVYRTGDLVRYIEDGSLEYLGRRDNQVKLRGQRLELGEIEQQLMTLPDVQQCVVLLPKEGRCRQKITAMLRLASDAADITTVGVVPTIAGGSEGLQVLGGDSVTSKLADICQALSGKLPSYMVPSCWMVTDRIHLLPSGKADRRFITGCITNIDKRMYRFSVDMKLDDVADGDEESGVKSNSPEPDMSPVARTLRQIWSSVLNLPEQTINPESGSFIRLGGDSISAMEVVAQSRSKGVPLLIENLLKATSVNALASMVEESNPSVSTSVVTVTHESEDDNEDDEIVLFGLSPIQRMFTKLSPRENHFNQSFLVKVNTSVRKSLSEDDVRKGLDIVVKRHAMLRARFQRIGRSFRQWIEREVDDSYTFRSWDVAPSGSFPAEAVPLIEDTQKSIDLESGPVFAGDLFSTGNDQFLFLTAHHLVVDLVSWRIILKDLEDYLTQGSITTYRSLSFENWCGHLNNHRKILLQAPNPTHLPFDVPQPDYNFWGMKQKPSYAADFEHHQFTLPVGVSQTLLGAANDAFGTEALDLFIAAVMHSFTSTFPDCAIPPVYNEGHGREPWDESHDLSKTVGWFTTIAPVWVKGKGDIVHFVKQVKDVRRKTPCKGFSHFTALDLDRKPFEIELSFNYFGAFQQLGRSDALLQQVQWESIGVDPCEVSSDHKKFSLIDIAAENSNDRLIFTFSFNSKLRHQQELKKWVGACQQCLETMSQSLVSRSGEIAVSDFEHLPENYNLEGLRNTTFKELDVSESNVADIYPCSPAQQGMLLTQSKDPGMYWFRSVYEVKSNSETPVTPARLRQAWKAIVQRHPLLRTIFIEQNSTDGLYDQMVLRNYEPNVSEMELGASMSDDKLLEKLKIDTVPYELQASRKPQHQLRIIRQAPSGRVFLSLLISHAIVDGGSMGVILRDLDLACQGKLVEAQPLLFKNYITYLKSRDHEADLAYWKQSLDGVDPCFLPIDPAAANSARIMGRTDLMTQDNRAYTKMTSVARELGVSLFTLLQVTWALTLRELVDPDRNNCCFGVVTSGRDLPVEGIRDIAGPLVNILASRVELPHDMPLSRIAEMVHNRFIDNLSHQTSSLAEVNHELGSGTLFNTGMTMQKVIGGASSQESGVSFHAVGGEDPTEFDVVIHAIDDGRELHVHMNYWCDKVSPNRAAEIARVFSTIQSQILQRPGMTPADLDIVSDKDVAQLWNWNARLPQAINKRIEDMITQRAAETPTREALWSTSEALNYHQLDVLSTKLAETHLVDLGREEIVPLCFEKSIWVAVAMVAVLKAGGTVVLMDPSHPADRLRSIVNTTKAKRVLASPSQANMCSETLGLHTIAISKNAVNTKATSTAPLARLRPRTSSDAAYIVFTSGSTGTPKGSVTEHRAFCTAVQGYHTAIGQLPGSRVLQFASYSFDASILEMLGSLMVGATVCIPSDRERSDSVSDFIRRGRISFAVVTPTTASLLKPEEVPSLTCLALCGEPMTMSHITLWADKVRLVNAFGPSECCVGSAANPRLNILSSPMCIGWAVSCCYWVVNPRNHNRLARVGSVGELLIEGPILARHYLGEETKTREAFITAPAWARPGRATRLYKTGDLVCQNADGTFQYVGRKDSQAKIRGQRLELGDVEQALRDVIPQCTSVVAEVIQNEGQVARLVVFFSGLGIDNVDVDIADIQSKMAQRVPAYMVPSSIVPLPQLPLMPSGKVDRKKTRAMAAELPTSLGERSGRAPESPMEVSLAAIWKTTVKTNEQILASDSFFHIGGDSFTAMKLVTEARSQGITLTVPVVMRAPKLEDMARQATWSASTQINALSGRSEAQDTEAFSMVKWTPALKADVSRQCRVPESNIEDVYPCTPLQEGLFVLSVKQLGSYMARHCFRLSPDLDIPRYKKAWNTIFESSLILRTHLVQLTNAGGLAGRKSGLYQAVIKKPLDWKHEITALGKYVATPPMPALGAALAAFTILEDKGAKYLVLTMHHAAYDGTSLDMLLKRVEAEYTGAPAPRVTPFREAIKYLDSTKGDPAKDFWTQYLAGAQASKFPVVPEGYVPSADTDLEHDFLLPTPKIEGFTISTLIRVAWSLVMAHHARSADIVVAETLSGRNDDREGIAEADGPLITTVPARCTLDPTTNIRDVLESMQKGMVDMISFQQAGLQNIRLMSADAAEACTFSCLVSIAPESVAKAKSAMGVTPVDGPPSPPIDYALSIQFVLGKDRELKVGVSFDNKLVDGVQMRRMIDQFGRILGQLCSGEKNQVRDIEVEMEPAPIEPVNPAAGLGVLNEGNMAKMQSQTAVVNDETVSNDNAMEGGSESSVPPEQGAPSTQESSNTGSGFVTARSLSEVREEMRALWAEILDIEGEDVDDENNFFRLGGDSISAMRLVTTAEHRNINIIVADVFHHPTFADLCEFAAQAHTALVVPPRAVAAAVSSDDDHPGEPTAVIAAPPPPVPQDYRPYAVLDFLDLDRELAVEAVCSQLNVFPGDVEDVFPATDYQAWAVSHGLMRSRGNTNYFLFRLHGNLDTFLLEQACRKMVASNPILRTLFTTIGSQVMQVVLRSYQIEFQRYGREHSADDSFIRWLVEQDTHREAFLSQSIVRFKLLRHTLGHYVLVMRVSHAQYDGMSLPLLCQDLQKAYGGSDPIVRPSFGKFIQGGMVREEAAINFWSQLLEGSSVTEIVEHTGPAFRHNVDTIRSRTIPPIPINVAGMTQATLVKAAWALVLAKMSGQRDIVFGNLIFGRNMPVSGIDEISGPCINMVPIRVRINEMDNIQDLLALVQEQQLAAMPHENLGFRSLVKHCTDWPTWTRFSSVVQHQKVGRNVGQDFYLGGDVKCEMGVLGPAYDSSDLWVQTTPLDDSFKVEIGSCSAVVSPKIAETLLDRLCTVLTIFGSVGSGNDHQLWELLARDHAPLIPVQSPIIDQVWSRVLPDGSTIPWDSPYYEYWGDEIAPVRFLEEYAEHNIHLDMEDILGNPTKQEQMMLTAHVMAEQNGTSSSKRDSRRDSRRLSQMYHPKSSVSTSVPTPNDVGNTSGSSRSFWMMDGPGKTANGSNSSKSGGSRGSSALGSPRMNSPRRGAAFVPQRSKAHRKGVCTSPRNASRSGSVWDVSSAASFSGQGSSSVSVSSPSLASSSRPRIGRKASAAVDF